MEHGACQMRVGSGQFFCQFPCLLPWGHCSVPRSSLVGCPPTGVASAEGAVSDWGRDLPPLLPHVNKHIVDRGMLANRRQGTGVFWLGKLRPKEGKGLTQTYTAHLVRTQDQSPQTLLSPAVHCWSSTDWHQIVK